MNPFFDFTKPRPQSLLQRLPRKAGKTALMWHALKREAARLGRAIECVECRRPHDGPPHLGRCKCGSYLFGIPSDTELQSRLPLEAEG